MTVMSESNNRAQRVRTLDFLSSKGAASLLVENTRAFGNAAAKISLQQATEAFSQAAESLPQADNPLNLATSHSETHE
jgi:hypothetical protein